MHAVLDPAILYFGTPVTLISSLNPDGSPHLAPMSSANILRTGERVLNLPSAALVDAVDRSRARRGPRRCRPTR